MMYEAILFTLICVYMGNSPWQKQPRTHHISRKTSFLAGKEVSDPLYLTVQSLCCAYQVSVGPRVSTEATVMAFIILARITGWSEHIEDIDFCVLFNLFISLFIFFFSMNWPSYVMSSWRRGWKSDGVKEKERKKRLLHVPFKCCH